MDDHYEYVIERYYKLNENFQNIFLNFKIEKLEINQKLKNDFNNLILEINSSILKDFKVDELNKSLDELNKIYNKIYREYNEKTKLKS